MSTYDYQVLVIDDIEEYARTMAKLIEKSCGISCIYALNPDSAKQILRESPIKVIIFDHQMPEMAGTDLFLQLRQIDTKFRSILLTAEALPEDLTRAKRIGMNELMIKDKDTYLLFPTILGLLYDYNNANNSTDTPFFKARVGSGWKREYVLYSIAGVFKEDNVFYFENEWKKKDEIRAGEKKTFSVNVESSEGVEISKGIIFSENVDLASQIALPIKNVSDFKSALTLEVKRTLSDKHSRLVKQAARREWERSFPADGEILYEAFETALLYRSVRIYIQVSFTWTKRKYIDAITINVPTGGENGRIIRLLRDGQKSIIYLNDEMSVTHNSL